MYELFPCSPSCELSCTRLAPPPRAGDAESGVTAVPRLWRRVKNRVKRSRVSVSAFGTLQSALTERSAEPNAGLEAGAAGRRLEI